MRTRFVGSLQLLLKLKAEGTLESSRKNSGRILGAREVSIAQLKYSIIQTAQQANGQIVQRSSQMKVKNLNLNEYELDTHIRELLRLQEDRCALTGIPFQFKGEHSDPNLLPSPDRIDSNGHYEIGNIQIVCQFVNFWKRATPNDEFMKLLVALHSDFDRLGPAVRLAPAGVSDQRGPRCCEASLAAV